MVSFAGEAFGEEEVGESLEGAAEDVVVLGWLGGGVELAAAVDDQADDCWAAVGELGVALEQADLAAHLAKLVVAAVGVLGVEDPDDALLAVVDDQVEVEFHAWWLPALGSDGEPVVSGCEVSDALDQDALPGDPGRGLPCGLGWLLARG